MYPARYEPARSPLLKSELFMHSQLPCQNVPVVVVVLVVEVEVVLVVVIVVDVVVVVVVVVVTHPDSNELPTEPWGQGVRVQLPE